jgi:ribosomal protein L32
MATMSLVQSISRVISTTIHRWFPLQPQLGLAAASCNNGILDRISPTSYDHDLKDEEETNTSTESGLWLFAVPKKKVSRGKKRMKTTRQKRIPLKKNIVVDPRTGEFTLMHKLPFNWKDYLPNMEKDFGLNLTLSEKGMAASNIRLVSSNSTTAKQTAYKEGNDT